MGECKPEIEYCCGLDLSLTATGLVVVDNNCKIVQQKLIASKNKDILRVIEIAEAVVTTLRFYTVKPAVFMEGYSYGSRVGQAFNIGELGGVVKVYLHNNGFAWTLIPPTTLKKFVTGKGNAKKELMLKEVFKKWGQDIDDNNLADAYGLARLAWSKLFGTDLLKYEKEVVDRI